MAPTRVVIGSALRAVSAGSRFSEQSESEGENDSSSLGGSENEPQRGNPTATRTLDAQKQTTTTIEKEVAHVIHRRSRRANAHGAQAAATTSYEMKKAVEKKFRTRYRSLQEAYENRLHALAVQVQHAVDQIQNDTTVFCLQENPLTSEFARIRIGEIVQECFFGEREKYIRVVSDQVAWQASDLREVQRKLRTVQQREKETQLKWKQSEREIHVLQQQLKDRVEELCGQKQITIQQEEKYLGERGERERLELELEKTKLHLQSFETLQRDYEALKARHQNEHEKEASVQDKYAKFVQEIESLKAINVKQEMEKHASEQEIAHLQHLLSLSDAKSRELSDSLRHVQSKDYPSKIVRLEAELSHVKQDIAMLEKENEELKNKYQEFGAQVEVYMKEQSHEKAAVLKKEEEQMRQVQAQLDAIRQQSQDALKAKQLEVVRFADQVQFRQEALTKAEQQIVSLEGRIKTLESQVADEKLRNLNLVGKFEKDVAHWRHGVEKEKEKLVAAEKAADRNLSETKEKYEAKIALLQESIEKRMVQNVKEKEAEARTRWQNEFVAKQEARIEALKSKYDAALENQQAELLRARQQALDSAAAITSKYEASKRSQRESEELDRKRREETAARERAMKDDERAREATRKRMQLDFDERERRLLEREKALVEKERKEEKRRAESVRQSTPPPSVVVLNMQAAEDGAESSGPKQTQSGSATVAAKRNSGRKSKRVEEVYQNQQEDSIPKAQHEAELQVREAQITLQCEERLQKTLLELQSKKEKEFRAAMVNVRKGIQKLEVAVDDSKKERKRVEQELLTERQAFVTLRQEFDEAKEAKQTVVQRLEEANDNIGKLRVVIKESQDKCYRLEQEMKAANRAEERSTLDAEEARQSIAELKDQLQLLTKLKEHQESELKATHDTQKQLQAQVFQLQGELQKAQEDLRAEQHASSERTQLEIQAASSHLDHQLRQVEGKEAELRLLLSDAKQKFSLLEKEMHETKQEKAKLESDLQQAKQDRLQQRKEFNNLTRIHKNLSETMNARIDEELSERLKVENLLHSAEKEINSIKLHKERVLLVYKMHLGQLKKETIAMQQAFKNELKMTLSYLEKDLFTASGEYEKQAALSLQTQINSYQQRFEAERREWEQRLQQKDNEINAVLGNRRVNDQSKYDQVVQRLEAKTKQLKEIEVQLKDLKDANATLQLTVHKMEANSERHRLEQSYLEDRLSSTMISTDRTAEENARTQATLEKRTKLCQIFHSFVLSLIKAHSLDIPGSFLKEVSANLQEKWEEEQLAAELDRVAELLYENSRRAILKAKEEGTDSVLNELESAKKAMHSLWSKPDAAENDDVYQHLPWYLIVNRSIKQLRDTAEREIASLKLELTSKETAIQELRQKKFQIQEANNVLRFEKETVVREMTLLSQSSSKKREQELQELRLDCERKIEQTKHYYGKEQIKTTQEYQATIDQLREALEVERRATSSMKSQQLTYQMEMEKAQEELKDKNARLEKQIDEIRDAAVKWKRKAKLAVTSTTSSVGANTPTRAHFLMSASSHATEPDSDTSFRMIFPPPLTPRTPRTPTLRTPRTPRRPSSAIADLSSLMEESLHSLRKDSLSSHSSFHLDR